MSMLKVVLISLFDALMEPRKVGNMPTNQYVINDPLHQVFNAVNAIFVQGYDEQCRVIYRNKGSELLYGYTQEDAIGQKIEFR